MNRKEFIESQGATCRNWTWSWSFINSKDKVIIFGAWDKNTNGNISRIFSEEWKSNVQGRKQPAYDQSSEHIRLIEQKGYQLKTFPIVFSNEKQDKHGFGPAKIKDFVRKLSPKTLIKVGPDWFASDGVVTGQLPEELDKPEQYYEGAAKTISVNIYERNSDARKKCIKHYGYKCAVCSFDFEKTYGNIGKRYIHVHHLIPISEIKKEYKLDPITDLRPICPNCHAIIHRTQPALGIEQLRQYMIKKNTMALQMDTYRQQN